jgi:hypothetical protein
MPEFAGNDRFEVRRRLGSGGFGTVYEALDRKRSAIVALKVLRGAGAQELYRFKQEFRGISGITHPNLVTLYELMSEGDRWFFSMELVRGLDFSSYVSGRDGEVESLTAATPDPRDVSTIVTLPESVGLASVLESPVEPGTRTVSPRLSPAPAEAPARAAPPPARELPPLPRLVGALRQLCSGLSALHAAGTVHRDVKPQNVLCTREGRVVVLDFGIAKDLTLERGESTESFIGTPLYMAPEQALERPVTSAADWYAVGVLLYEALTGVLPFAGSALSVLREKVSRDPLPPSTQRPEIPAALDALCMLLLDRDPERRPTGREIQERLAAIEADLGGKEGATSSAVVAAAPRRREDPFVGRGAHLASLLEAYEESRQGRAVVALCHGGSGVGKSTLCRRFLQEIADRDDRVLTLAGRCFEHEDVPFKALDGVIDSLGQFLARRTQAEVLAVLPRDASALARLFPVLLQVPAVKDAPARRIADDLQIQQAAFAALRELLIRLSDRRPMVIHVDDLQWGDPDGVSLLLEILRRPAPPSLLLVIGYRSEDEASSEALQMLRRGLQGDLGRCVSTREIPVGELSSGDAEELARALLPEAERDRAIAVAAEARGNAFFVTELSRMIADARPAKGGGEGIASLDEVLRARAALLPDASRRLLEVVAVAGQPISRAAARAAAFGGSPEIDEPKAIALLRAGRLIRVRHASAREGAGPGEDLLPYHDRVREAVVDGLSPDALSTQHLGLARVLEASGQAEPERLVFHFQRGGDTKGAARYAVRASAQALASLAFHQAARLCRAALATGELSTDEAYAVEVRLADALARAGHPREAAEAYVALVDREGPEMALHRRRQAAGQFFAGGYIPEGQRVVHQLLTAVGLGVPRTMFGLVLTLLLFRTLIALRGRSFQERSEAEIPAKDLLRIDTCEAVGAVASADPVLSSSFRLWALWYALRAGEPKRIARAFAREALILAATRAPDAQVNEVLARSVEIGARLRDPYTLGLAAYVEGHIAHLGGRFRRSAASLRRAAAIFQDECTEASADIDFMWTIRVYNLRWMGSIRDLSEELPPLLKEAVLRGKQSQEIIVRLIAGFVLPLADDDPDRADEGARAVERRIEGQPFNLQHVFLLEVRLLVLLYRGEGEEAQELLAERWGAVERSRQLDLEFFAMVWTDLRALVALSAGTTEPGAVEKAARRLAKGRPLFAAPMASALRALLRHRQGRRADALALLQQAEAGFSGCDMALHVAAIRLRRGALLGGEEGERIAAEGRAWMAAQGIRSPERMARLVLPDLA